MRGRYDELERVLRSAANALEGSAPELPFGFDTRVVALWRAGNGLANDTADLTRFLRQIGVVAFAVLTLASTGAYVQFNDNETRSVPHNNEYAIADFAIQTEFSP